MKTAEEILTEHVSRINPDGSDYFTHDHIISAMEEYASQFRSEWIEYGKPFPPLGIEVMAFKPEWIDEDFNPRGIRIGFQNEMESEEGTFVSAEWLDYHDSYMTRDGEIDKPTLWMPLPAAPKGGEDGR